MNSKELGKVLKIQNGFAFKSSEYKSSGVPLVRISNITDGIVNINGDTIYVDKQYLSSKKEFIVEKGDVVIALSGATTGKYGIYLNDFPSLLNQRIGIIKAGKSDVVDSTYFYFFLNVLKDEILRTAAGAAQPNISTKDIGKFKIPLPPLPEQQRIAKILDAADSLRKKTQQIIDSYDELAQSIFLDMFGDPATNPKDWNMKLLQEVLLSKTQNGHYLPKENYSEKGVAMIHMSDAFYGIAQLNNVKRVLVSEKEIEKFKLQNTDILLARRSLNYEGAAKPCLIPISIEPLIYESSLIRLRPDQHKINTIFLFYYFNNENARKAHVYKYITRSTISGINNRDLNNIKIYVPPISLQNQFAEKIELIEKQKELAKQSLKESEDLFNSLLQKAFKGELSN